MRISLPLSKMLLRAVLGLFLSLLLGSFVGFSDPPSSNQQRSLLERVSNLDPWHGDAWRPLVRGAFRTSMGLQIHPRCFDYFSRLERPRTRREIEELLNSAISRIFQKMISCDSDYHELDSWITQWVGQMRRAVITCSEDIYGAESLTLTTIESIHDPSAMRGIDGPTHVNFIFSRKPVIVFPRRVLLTIAHPVTFKIFENAFIHEGFHHTDANAYFAGYGHNRFPALSWTRDHQVASCQVNQIFDRVYFVANLCSKSRPFELSSANSYGDILQPELLALFSRSCPRQAQRMCVDMFSSQGFSLAARDLSSMFFSISTSLDMPSGRLQGDLAAQLCTTIESEGRCQHYVGHTSPRLVWQNILNSNPDVAARWTSLRDRVRQRMNLAFVPEDSRHIPRWLWHPQLEVLQSQCFQRNFELDPRGFWIYRGLHAASQTHIPVEPPTQTSAEYVDRILKAKYQSLSRFISALQGDPFCSSEESYALRSSDVVFIEGAPLGLFARLSLLAESGDVVTAFDETRLGRITNFREELLYQVRHPFFDLGNNVFGQDLVNEFIDFLIHYHPKSSQLDCRRLRLRYE